MSYLIPTDCEICQKTNVVSINTDFIHQLGYPTICKRNKLEYSQQMVKTLNEHFLRHLTKPSQALAQRMIKEEAIDLKNTVVEANIALDQIDDLKGVVYLKISALANDSTPKDLNLLIKSYADLLKRETDLLQLHHKVSGKAQQEDLMKAALGGMIMSVTRALGEEKVKKIRQGSTKKGTMSFFENDPHLQKLFKELEGEVHGDKTDQEKS